jgi:hypothetical protein
LLDKINVDQPKWKELTAESDVFAFAAQVGYPVSLPSSLSSAVWSQLMKIIRA